MAFNVLDKINVTVLMMLSVWGNFFDYRYLTHNVEITLTKNLAMKIFLSNKIQNLNKILFLRPCKLNNLFLIPVRANFLPPSGYILCFVVEYLISVNNPRRIYIVSIVF